MTNAKTPSLGDRHDAAERLSTPGEYRGFLCVTGAILLVLLTGLVVLERAGTLGGL
jgi:hypothetical protein